MKFQFQFEPVFALLGIILQGALLTIELSAGAIVLGFGVAILLSAVRSMGPRWAQWLVDAYVELMRNTPFLVQLLHLLRPADSGMRMSAPSRRRCWRSR